MLSFIYLKIDVIFLKFQLRPHHYERPPVGHSSPSVSRGTRTAVGLRSHQIQSSVGLFGFPLICCLFLNTCSIIKYFSLKYFIPLDLSFLSNLNTLQSRDQ